jgi:hypothetical protein
MYPCCTRAQLGSSTRQQARPMPSKGSACAHALSSRVVRGGQQAKRAAAAPTHRRHTDHQPPTPQAGGGDEAAPFVRDPRDNPRCIRCAVVTSQRELSWRVIVLLGVLVGGAGVCEAQAPTPSAATSASAASCTDDPHGVLAKANASCAQVLALGCSTDLNAYNQGAPPGFLVKIACPKSCKVCVPPVNKIPPAVPVPACVDDPKGLLASVRTSCAQVLPLGCNTDLSTVDPRAPTGMLVKIACPKSCSNCNFGGGILSALAWTDNATCTDVASAQLTSFCNFDSQCYDIRQQQYWNPTCEKLEPFGVCHGVHRGHTANSSRCCKTCAKPHQCVDASDKTVSDATGGEIRSCAALQQAECFHHHNRAKQLIARRLCCKSCSGTCVESSWPGMAHTGKDRAGVYTDFPCDECTVPLWKSERRHRILHQNRSEDTESCDKFCRSVKDSKGIKLTCTAAWSAGRLGCERQNRIPCNLSLTSDEAFNGFLPICECGKKTVAAPTWNGYADVPDHVCNRETLGLVPSCRAFAQLGGCNHKMGGGKSTHAKWVAKTLCAKTCNRPTKRPDCLPSLRSLDPSEVATLFFQSNQPHIAGKLTLNGKSLDDLVDRNRDTKIGTLFNETELLEVERVLRDYGRTSFGTQYRSDPPSMSTCSKVFSNTGKDPVLVSVKLYPKRLVSIDNHLSAFTLKYSIVVTWADDRYVRPAENSAASDEGYFPLKTKQNPSGVMQPFWIPELKLANEISGTRQTAGEWGPVVHTFGRLPYNGRFDEIEDITHKKLGCKHYIDDFSCDTVVLRYKDKPASPNCNAAHLRNAGCEAWGVLHYWDAIATFTNDFDYARFPYDVQTLKVLIRVTGENNGISHVQLADSAQIKLKDLVAGSDEMAQLQKTFDSLPGWNLQGYLSASRQPEGKDRGSEHDGIEFSFDIARDSAFYIYNLVLPVVIVTVCTLASFMLHPSECATRVTLCVTLLLAMLTFQSVASNYVPPTGKTTAYHQFVLMSMSHNLVVFFESIVVFKLPRWLHLDSVEGDEDIEIFAFVDDFFAIVTVPFYLSFTIFTINGGLLDGYAFELVLSVLLCVCGPIGWGLLQKKLEWANGCFRLAGRAPTSTALDESDNDVKSTPLSILSDRPPSADLHATSNPLHHG